MGEIIRRPVDGPVVKEQLPAGSPQVSYNSDGRIVVRIIQSHGGDTLIVLDRGLSDKLIRFIQQALHNEDRMPF